jgi:hypothetical protein
VYRVALIGCGAAAESLKLPSMAQEWDRQYAVFVNSIRRGTVTEATVEDGPRALEITAACETSARTGAAVLHHESGHGSAQETQTAP